MLFQYLSFIGYWIFSIVALWGQMLQYLAIECEELLIYTFFIKGLSYVFQKITNNGSI
jgi:hypothetical protein